MSNIKDIQRRIKSVRNTGKITRAMEMVSVVKMRKSVDRVLSVRPYAHAAWDVLQNLSKAFNESHHELLEVRKVKNVLMIVVTSNRGLCGAFNSQIIKKVKSELGNTESLRTQRINGKNRVIGVLSGNEEVNVDFITIGRKGEGLVKKLGHNIIAAFPELSYFPTVVDIRPLSKIVMDDYSAKKYDKVIIAYTDYHSAVSQEPKIRQLLPISKRDLKKEIGEMDEKARECEMEEKVTEYKVEPKPEEVLGGLVRRLVEMQIYHGILESNASKEAARMMAMKNATESANEMVEDLTLESNQIRQMKITQEIAEISAGRSALE